MKKWVLLGLITLGLIVSQRLFGSYLDFHPAFGTIVIFFAVQTYVLFRIDHWVPVDWKAQMALVKMVIRFISTLSFVLIIMLNNGQKFILVIQFMLVYLIYLIFEIVVSLTNLRRN